MKEERSFICYLVLELPSYFRWDNPRSTLYHCSFSKYLDCETYPEGLRIAFEKASDELNQDRKNPYFMRFKRLRDAHMPKGNKEKFQEFAQKFSDDMTAENIFEVTEQVVQEWLNNSSIERKG